MNKISTLFLFLSLNLFGQVNNDSIRQIVLNNSVTDSLYIFGKWNNTGGTEIQLRYLGEIKGVNGNFKIMTSCWLWGLSKRATNRILIFSEDKRYLGNYYITTKSDLPEKIENNQLVFSYSEGSDCDKKVMTKLSFGNGIPKQLLVECKNGYGNIYSFEKEKNE